jgi:dTDP-4-amino-4,6-dideoxygalactose transaminase
MTKIPITKPFFDENDSKAILRPLESGWVVQGPFVEAFEAEFSLFTGALHSVATSSCTTALHLAMAVLRLKPGDEVIVPAFTWVSTANVVEYMGARPVFCDIELHSYNIDVARVESLITERTVGIIPVHLFGLCADMAPLMEIAARHHLWVVEDAACAFGSRYYGRHAGTFGEMGCFSFHPRKSVTTGEGGMVTTQRPEFDRLLRSLRDHGASRTDFQRHSQQAAFLLAEYNDLGYNYRLTDIQGALGCSQMRRAAWIMAERTRRAQRYDELLRNIEWLRTPSVPHDYAHGYQAYVCLFCPENPTIRNVGRLHDLRNAVMSRLEEEGIATRQGTHAPVLTGYYRNKYGFVDTQFPNALLAERLTLTLPLYVQLTDEEQGVVADRLRHVLH